MGGDDHTQFGLDKVNAVVCENAAVALNNRNTATSGKDFRQRKYLPGIATSFFVVRREGGDSLLIPSQSTSEWRANVITYVGSLF